MRNKLIFILLIFSATIGLAQDNACRKSTEGTDFWFGFMENRDGSEERFVEITVTSREATSFQIFIGPDENPFGGVYTVAANDSRQVKIPWEDGETLGSEQKQEKGIHLVAEKPVNVYALNWDINSADVAVIYPVGSLGKEYFAMCYYPDIDPANPISGNGRNSEFLVVASEDFTQVEITPSKVTDQNWPADSTFIVTLNAGEVYQVQSENIWDSDEEGQGDLTGSFIKADKPVAFYSGSLATRVPNGQCCWDHLYEQMPPIQAWGKEYFTVPLKSRKQDRYRVMAAEDNSTVYISGRNPIQLNRGEFEELVFLSDDPKRILGDKPILVAQFSQSNAVDSAFTSGDGDPFMTILSTTEQSKNDVTFVTYKSPELDSVSFFYSGIERYFVNIVTKNNEVPGMILNENTISEEFINFPGNNDYSYAQIEIEQGTHRLNNTDQKGGFLAYVYGFGGFESYGYGVGFNLDLVLDLGESIFFESDTLLLCKGDTLTLDAGSYFDSFNWNTGSKEPQIQVIEEGLYYVTASTNDGCVLTDSVFVFPSNPEAELGIEYPEECEPFSLPLEIESGYEKYVWQNEFGDTLSTENKIVADETGVYKITVFDEYNCTASDQMQLVIYPVPDVEIASESLICGKKSTSLEVAITGAPESIWNYEGSFEWSTNNPGNINFSNESHTSVELTAKDWGEYEIYYKITTTDNCESIDTFTIGFFPVPSSGFDFLDTGEKCAGYTREVIYIGDADQTANYLWDFGSSKMIDSIDWDRLTVSLGTYNTNPLLQLVVEQNGCYSDTTSKAIGTNPDFRLETGVTRGCDSVNVQFEGELQVPDSLLFEWDFGDGSPISNEQNPTHFYERPGMYDVDLTVTNQNSGCQIGFQVDSMVKVFPTPTAEISANPDVCYPDTIQIYYTNSIDSTIANWQLIGIHQVGGSNDSIVVVLDNPVGTVGLTINEFGCLSDTAEMRLKRKPDFDFFTADTTGCSPFTADIIAQPNDDMLRFDWITDSIPFPGETITRVYRDSGRYDVGLIAESLQTGCNDTLIKTNWITVYPKPSANFTVNFQTALIDNANISFTNLSDNAAYYLWEFGDGEISNEFSPTHRYTKLGEFTTSLIVESEPGCTDTTTYDVTIIPNAAFAPNAFRPDSPIDENRTFMPVGQEGFQSNFSLKIYDRLGQLVFETNSVANPWDGTTKNGQPAPMGNYIWIADFRDIQGFEKHQKGQVLLIR